MSSDVRTDHTRGRRAALGLAILAPLLSGPYFHSCVAPAHGVAPAGGVASAEAAMAEAQTTSVLVLGGWDQREICFEEEVQDPAYDPYLLPTHQTGHCVIPTATGWADAGTCSCYGTLAAPWFERAVLDAWVAKRGASCAGGRSTLIQLGPLFPSNGYGRSVPGYLKLSRFDSPEMLRAFAAHWDAWSEILAQPQFKASFGNAEFLISIGNEIELYLDHPEDKPDLPGAPPPRGTTNSVHATRADAWADYAAFFAKAAAYVRGGTMDLGDGTVLPHTGQRGFPRLVTFTTTWTDGCSVGPRVLNAGTPSRIPAECRGFDDGAFWDMAGHADFWTYTRYKPFEGDQVDDGNVQQRAYDDLMADFNGMKRLANGAALVGKTRSPLPVIIQEIGQPSSRDDYTDDLLAPAQAEYVTGAMRAFVDYNRQWPSVTDWWGGIFTGQAPVADGPFARPRVLGFNWFMLNDFGGVQCPADAGSPTTQVCSWGLRQTDGTPKPAWGAFVDAGVALNPPALDLDRDCLQ